MSKGISNGTFFYAQTTYMLNKLKKLFCRDLYNEIKNLTMENAVVKQELVELKVKSQATINQVNKHYKGILRRNNIRE